MPSSSQMGDWQHERFSDDEAKALFARLFPHGFAGADVLEEIAPEGWEHSPLLACFHPSVERVFEEQLQMHRNIESLVRARTKDDAVETREAARPEPTLEDVRRTYEPQPVQEDEELTELVGQCLWDVFSDNHEVIAADRRVVDIGSFRGASAFLDDYARDDSGEAWEAGDYMRFYMGSIWISGRVDLTPVYAMIFRRLKSSGADWIHHFPELAVVDFGPLRADAESPGRYSPSEALAKERQAREQQAETERFRGELADANASAREDALDRPPPETVRAYRQVYGCDPRGWPPA